MSFNFADDEVSGARRAGNVDKYYEVFPESMKLFVYGMTTPHGENSIKSDQN